MNELHGLLNGHLSHPGAEDDGRAIGVICLLNVSSRNDESARWILLKSASISPEEELGVLRVQHRLLRDELIREMDIVKFT